MRIALDVMGGDHAPFSNIEGALLYLNDYKNPQTQIILVGNKSIIEKTISKNKNLLHQIEIIHTTEIVEMDEKPSRIFRTKPNSSLVKCIELLKNGIVDAVISAGNTGALLTSSLFMLGKIDRILRPALAPYVPIENGGFILCDAGANMDLKPQHLLQFAIMASSYLEIQTSIKSPRVGLINIGIEEGKGNELTKAAYTMLKNNITNFTGNIESRYLLDGKVDVAVCDGFTGNIILKLTEGIFNNITKYIEKEINNQKFSNLDQISMSLKNRYDFEEYGGTPLLGINGIVMKCHGASSKKSIRNTIKSVKKFHDEDLINKIGKKMILHSDIFNKNKNHNEIQSA